MKVTLVHDHVGGKAGGGGGVRQLLGLAIGLRDLGHDVVVVCRDHEPGTEPADVAGIDLRAVRTGPVEVPAGQRALLRRWLRDMRDVAALVPGDTDAINAHEWPALRAGRIASRRTGAPLVWTRNDETVWERATIPGETIASPGGPAGRLLRLGLGSLDALDARAARAIVVLDQRNARMVQRAYRRSAAVVQSGPAPRFFDPPSRDDARARLGVEPGEFVVAGVGILFPHRRFEDLIEAIAATPDLPEVKAHIVGSDYADTAYADRLEALAAERGVAGRVRLPRESITDEALRDVYAAADAFVFPNQRQTWGLAPLEALASRTPAIVSSGAGVHEVLEGRPGVRVVPPERPDAIAEAIRAIRAGVDPGGLETTREWIRTELSPRAYAAGMAAVYERARAS